MRTDLLLGLALVCGITNTMSSMQQVMYPFTDWLVPFGIRLNYWQGYALGSMNKENEIKKIIDLFIKEDSSVNESHQDIARRINLIEYGKKLYLYGQTNKDLSRANAYKSSFSIGSFCAGALCATLGLGAYYLLTKGSSSSLIFDSAKA